MSENNLTQHQINLKSLQESLLKICDEHRKTQECFIELQTQARSAWYHVNKSSTDIMELLLWIDEMIDDAMPKLPQLNITE